MVSEGSVGQYKVLRVRYNRIRTFASLFAYETKNKILPNVRGTFVAIGTYGVSGDEITQAVKRYSVFSMQKS